MRRPYRFCPHCATPLKRRRHYRGDDLRPTCPACGFTQFDNPTPGAAVLVINDQGQVLLGKRARAPFKGHWGIPGGFVEGAEHPERAAVREVLEETGVTVKLDGVLGIFMDRYGRSGDDTVNIFYLGRVLAGEPRPTADVTRVAWFAPHALPRRVAFRNNREALQAWLRNPIHHSGCQIV